MSLEPTTPATRWNGIRYRGDLQDVKEMSDVYRVDHYVAAAEENLKYQVASQRQALMKRGIVLTPRLSPRIYSIFHKACAAFGIETEVEVICIRQPEVNAFAVVVLPLPDRPTK